MPDEVLFEVSDHVAVVTLNRPEALNAINAALGSALMAGLRRIRDDDDIRVGIITGAGRAFSAGADLKERAQSGSATGGAGAGVAGFLTSDPNESFYRMTVPKPLIAAVNGYCLGGGLELALTCDIRIASSAARFGLPEISRGFFPGAGGPLRLPRAIPQAMAMEMLLTGDPIGPETTLRAGLISRVVAPEELMPAARKLADRIASHAPLAVRAVKELAYTGLDMSLDQSLRFGGSLRWIIGQTEDAREGPRAFAEGREPRYEGH